VRERFIGWTRPTFFLTAKAEEYFSADFARSGVHCSGRDPSLQTQLWPKLNADWRLLQLLPVGDGEWQARDVLARPEHTVV